MPRRRPLLRRPRSSSASSAGRTSRSSRMQGAGDLENFNHLVNGVAAARRRRLIVGVGADARRAVPSDYAASPGLTHAPQRRRAPGTPAAASPPPGISRGIPAASSSKAASRASGSRPDRCARRADAGAGRLSRVADRLKDYRRKRDAEATPEPAGEPAAGAPRTRRRAAGASSSRSTTRRACTGTCASSTTASPSRGRSPTGSPRTPRTTASRSTPRTIRSSTSSSRATSRRAPTAPGRCASGTAAPTRSTSSTTTRSRSRSTASACTAATGCFR